jgi:2'-5' RNA ligase
MRVFYAINLPERVRDSLRPIVAKAREDNQTNSLRWVKPELLHLTLHFLGEQDEDSVNEIINSVEDLLKPPDKPEVEIGEWGGFPDLVRPRIIYISLNHSESLLNLQKNLGLKLGSAGYDIDKRPWRSHITAARNKEPAQRLDLKLPPLPNDKWIVESFDLMKSTLTPNGPVYQLVKSFDL